MMRIVLTSLMAFLISGLAGGMTAQVLAVATGATEEYILVFAATVLVVICVTLIFFVAQFFGDQVKSMNRAAIATLALFALVLLVLIGWTFSVPAEQRATGSDMAIIAGLVLPGVVTILVQWLFVRWRVGNTRSSGGRPGS